ncbi:ras-related protein Rab-32 [Salmo salar]|uniref:Ras-related protein Rab n=1 Tax=Salmo salar TaxID=8030 RepID=A0A1S3RMH1_SALSA|nr:ras-related protein Rab-32 [Salmo salar]|eukprot:XP_014053531.1 PREDICTED: ras-related protein Rab-32-like [Salmo salar]
MAGGSVSVCTECLFKVLVIGERGVGKTSMRFKEEYKASIGVDFALKTIEWDNKTVVRLQLWDIAGQERIRNMSRVYYKEAMGAFVVFDTTKMETLEAASQWKHDLDSKVRLASGSPVPAVLLANKCDQTEGNKELFSLMDNYCKEKGFLGWFETSAKDNLNVDEAGAFLMENMLRIDRGLSSRDNENDRINMSQSKATFKCC